MRFRIISKKTLCFIVAIIIILVVFSFSQSESASPVKSFFYSISKPLQERLWRGGEGTFSFFERLTRCKKLQEENEELARENNELLARISSCSGQKEENERLRKALELDLPEEFDLEISYLVEKDITNDFILIDKGLEDDFKIGMFLITEERVLVGKIVEVYNSFSRVSLVSSKGFSFPAKVLEKDILGIVKGRGNFNLSFEEIPKDKDITEGDIVITSSLGGNFPKDLLVGEVRNIKESSVDPFKITDINPLFDIEDLDSIFVVTNFKEFIE